MLASSHPAVSRPPASIWVLAPSFVLAGAPLALVFAILAVPDVLRWVNQPRSRAGRPQSYCIVFRPLSFLDARESAPWTFCLRSASRSSSTSFFSSSATKTSAKTVANLGQDVLLGVHHENFEVKKRCRDFPVVLLCLWRRSCCCCPRGLEGSRLWRWRSRLLSSTTLPNEGR